MGELSDVRRVHEGPLFDVFRATHDGSDIAIKCIAPTDGPRRLAVLGSRWEHSDHTNLYTTRELGWSAVEATPELEHFEALLEAEHAVIKRVASDWNHPGAWLARWQPEGRLVGDWKGIESGRLCLVTPWCAGHSFASLSSAEQRRMFPRMLPALWRALAVCPHGDLKLDAFWLDPGGWFRIVDPGVSISGPERSPATRGLEFSSRLFLTNANYALVHPEHGPAAPRLSKRAGGLPSVLEDQELHAHVGEYADAAEPREPAIADVVALGVLYVRILTGTSLAVALGIETPLWAGFWSDKGHHPEPRHLEVLARLPGVLDGIAATPLERRLAAQLVMLGLTQASIEPLATEVLASLA